MATIEASGTKVITLSTETRAQIRESAAPVYESIRGAINEEIYEAYMN